MNYTETLNSLNKADSFDLYRLSLAIEQEIRRPERINLIKQKLHIGMQLSFFCYTENRLIKGQLLEMKKTKAVVFDLEKNKSFLMPYYVLNLESKPTDIIPPKSTGQLNINNVSVGDHIGFTHDGINHFGRITRINRKTVTVKLNNGQLWRVYYPHLFKIYQAEVTTQNLDSPID